MKSSRSALSRKRAIMAPAMVRDQSSFSPETGLLYNECASRSRPDDLGKIIRAALCGVHLDVDGYSMV